MDFVEYLEALVKEEVYGSPSKKQKTERDEDDGKLDDKSNQWRPSSATA